MCKIFYLYEMLIIYENEMYLEEHIHLNRIESFLFYPLLRILNWTLHLHVHCSTVKTIFDEHVLLLKSDNGNIFQFRQEVVSFSTGVISNKYHKTLRELIIISPNRHR